MRKAQGGELNNLLEEEHVLWEVHWDLTYACQQNCSYCCAKHLHSWNRNQELPTSRVFEILDEMQCLGTYKLTFGGGDPFMCGNFLDIVKYAANCGFRVTVLSSGIAIDDEIARQLRKASVSQVEVTFLGADATTHDEVSQVPGSFDHICQSIVSLRRAEIPVLAKTLLTKRNFGQIEAFEELAQELDISFQKATSIWRPWGGSEDEVAHLRLGREMLREYYMRYNPPKPKPGNKNYVCSAGRRMLGITPYGQVNPCGNYATGMVLGDLRMQTLTEIWQGSLLLQQYLALQSESYPKCYSCQIRAFCDWCPALFSWGGNQYTEPYDQLCRETEIKRQAWEEVNGCEWTAPADRSGLF